MERADDGRATPGAADCRRPAVVHRGDGGVRAEGRGGEGDHTVIGRYLRDNGNAWLPNDAFQALAAAIRAERLEETPHPARFVPATELRWVQGDEFLGRTASGTGSRRRCWRRAATQGKLRFWVPTRDH